MRWSHAVLAISLALMSAGCTTGGSSSAAPTAYRLELDPEAIPQLSQRGGVLRIAKPEAAAGVDTRGIAYRRQAHALRYYTRSRWADRPVRMLENVLTSAFEASGLFRAVVDDTRVPADYLLTGQLLRLEQHVPPEGEPIVEMRLRLQLMTLPERRLLASRVLEARAPSPSVDAAGAVAAANAALAEVAAEAVRFVDKALATGEQAAGR
jgi:cholesterol transport system auxiliary component